MLEALHIRNYALIDSLDLRFREGLTVVTGETGAGKSIIIGALGVALGDRVTAGEIRSGLETCEVTAVFNPQVSGEVLQWFSARSIVFSGEALLMRRVVRRRGRGCAFVQSVPVPLADYSDLGKLLLAVHGQHQHQSLLSVTEQRRLIDRYAAVEGLVAEISASSRRLSEMRNREEQIREDLERSASDRELFRHAIDEINSAEIRDGEERELLGRRHSLRNRENIKRLVSSASVAISESQGGAGALLRSALQAIRDLCGIDRRYESLSQQLETTLYEIEDIYEALSETEDDFVNPDDLLVVEDRLAAIRAVIRKYDGTEAGALQYAKECRQRLMELESADNDLQESAEQFKEIENSFKVAAATLSSARQDAASELQGLVQEELHHLGMPRARFEVSITPRQEGIGSTGMDVVEFLLEANPGEGFSGLRSVAAGGELSRVMLALTAIPNRYRQPITSVFDEIDAGVGGQVGVAIGERLRRISEHQQVLCITHLATVAACADDHIKVEKRSIGERASVVVGAVDGADRRDEIARTLAGDRSNGVPQEHASLLLAAARGSSR